MSCGPIRLSLAAFVAAVSLAACEPTVALRGYMVDEDRLATLAKGSTKEQVVAQLGTPQSVGTFDKSTWYYMGERTEQESFFDPDVTDRKIVVVTFDGNDRISGITKLDKDAGQDVAMVERETEVAGRDYSFLEQLLGNVGRFGGKKKKGGS